MMQTTRGLGYAIVPGLAVYDLVRGAVTGEDGSTKTMSCINTRVSRVACDVCGVTLSEWLDNVMVVACY